MTEEKTKFALTEFFGRLFSNFGRLLLTNLIFAVPLAVFFALFYIINYLTGLNSVFILLLTVIPVAPFYSGVTLITSKIVRGEENVEVFPTFVAGVKENLLKFLFHGVVLYLAVLFSCFSISVYSAMISQAESGAGFFCAALVISVIIIVAFLFIFYYIFPMTVTFDLSLKNIYKNSALMSFGELKHNIFATFGLFVFALVCATLLMLAGSFNSSLAVILTTAVLAVFFAPSLVSFITNSAVYSRMYSMITDREKKAENLSKKIERRRAGDFMYDPEDVRENTDEELLKLEIDENADGDEYIFFNGKMIKRSAILKLKNERNKASRDDAKK